MDAIILTAARSRVRIAGLTAGERAVRVARRVGATRVMAVEDRRALAAWTGDAVLVIRADQLVHTPLVAPLVAAPDDLAIAVDPDGAYAGAIVARGARATELVAALARGDDDAALAAAVAVRVPHGPLARHPIATADERRAAHRMLYQILIKPQDNAITRYLYRPVSFPLTRLLVWTPITPNQVSYAVAALVALGCWLTAGASHAGVLAGTAVILAASYLDCCDGEIARVKLLSSRWGAWLDTIVDELTSLGYLGALGWHCHLAYGGDAWLWLTAIGCAGIALSMYGIYYNLIVVVGSANSQDYAGKVEAVPGRAPSSIRLRPAPATSPTRARPRWLQLIATYAPYAIRRDFIAWAALGLAAAGATRVLFALFWLGGVLTAIVVTIDHVKLVRLRRSIARGGQILESAS
jgi:phosphatidylglycerophosphate synthase